MNIAVVMLLMLIVAIFLWPRKGVIYATRNDDPFPRLRGKAQRTFTVRCEQGSSSFDAEHTPRV